MTTPEPQLSKPLKIRGGTGRLRLYGRWQLARQTSVRAELGSVTVDLTDAVFDDRVVDLSIYTGWGPITIIAPPGVGHVLRNRGTIVSRIEPPILGFPLVRLKAITNIGRIRLVPTGWRPPRRRLDRP